MTNEEKARDIGKDWYNAECFGVAMDSDIVAEQAALEAMQWKEKQLIDKCKEFCDRQTTGEYYNRQGVFQIDKYIDDMLNFIKGE